jgi:hypothetical protein
VKNSWFANILQVSLSSKPPPHIHVSCTLTAIHTSRRYFKCAILHGEFVKESGYFIETGTMCIEAIEYYKNKDNTQASGDFFYVSCSPAGVLLPSFQKAHLFLSNCRGIQEQTSVTTVRSWNSLGFILAAEKQSSTRTNSDFSMSPCQIIWSKKSDLPYQPKEKKGK